MEKPCINEKNKSSVESTRKLEVKKNGFKKIILQETRGGTVNRSKLFANRYTRNWQKPPVTGRNRILLIVFFFYKIPFCYPFSMKVKHHIFIILLQVKVKVYTNILFI